MGSFVQRRPGLFRPPPARKMPPVGVRGEALQGDSSITRLHTCLSQAEEERRRRGGGGEEEERRRRRGSSGGGEEDEEKE